MSLFNQLPQGSVQGERVRGRDIYYNPNYRYGWELTQEERDEILRTRPMMPKQFELPEDMKRRWGIA